jgi:hypothetical protein
LSAPAESGLRAFLARLVLDLCPDTIKSAQERVASMKCPEPSAATVADYCAERLAAGLFSEPMSLDLPRALLPCFIELSDELYRAIQSGAVERWLRPATDHAFSVEFVARLAAFIDNCLSPHRKEAA